MTLSIPSELHKKMKEFAEVRWSHVARRAIEERIEDLEMMNKIAQKSKLTEKDVKNFAQKIKKNASRRFYESGN